LGEEAYENQKDYLKFTPKPDKMSVKDWINRIKNINSYLPLMEHEARSFSERELIAEVISKNIPSAWKAQFKLSKLHLKTRIKDIMGDLTIIEEVTHPKSNKKQLKNPCRLHGNHEWDECRQNPKNQKSENKNESNDKNRNRNGNGNGTGNNRNREEHRRTERPNRQPSRESSRERNRHRSPSRSRRESSDSESDNEYHYINCHSDNNKSNERKTPSSEILIAIPAKKGSKKYTTYLGLIDSGASGSLVNKELVEFADFDVKLQKKPTKWDTANGIIQTDGSVIIENYNLPQFSRKRNITTSFHMYHKKATDKYDFILGRDLLTDLGLDIHYSASQFVWENITVDMVPSGYWNQEKISTLAKTWNSKRKPTREDEPKVESVKEENTKKTSTQTVENETKQALQLDQNITDQPTDGKLTEEILTLQEENADDTPNDRLLRILTTDQSNYEEQPVTQKAKLNRSKTAVAALPVQPYKIDQKMQVPTKSPFTINKVNNNDTVAINRGTTAETIRRIKPYYS
jgi:hypothetical protein